MISRYGYGLGLIRDTIRVGLALGTGQNIPGT